MSTDDTQRRIDANATTFGDGWGAAQREFLKTMEAVVRADTGLYLKLAAETRQDAAEIRTMIAAVGQALGDLLVEIRKIGAQVGGLQVEVGALSERVDWLEQRERESSQP